MYTVHFLYDSIHDRMKIGINYKESTKQFPVIITVLTLSSAVYVLFLEQT